jgi:hypothetical protein
VLCRQFFGPAPAQGEALVGFDLTFAVANPNQVPLPLAEILTGVTVFPDATQQSLGATCVKLCAPGDAACTGQPDGSSCKSSSSDVRGLDDLGGAVVGFLLSQGLALAAGQAPSFRAPQVTAASSLDVIVRFTLAPERLLSVLEQAARQAVDDLKAGREIELRIPYRVQGTVWADGGSIGRLAAGYGPMAGVWDIPTTALLPAAP